MGFHDATLRAAALTALLLAAAPGGDASELADRYPPGSIKERARAEAALRDAEREQARIESEFTAREAECYNRFLVNRCRDQARQEKLTAERDLRRVRVEAHDLQRQLDAQDAAHRRAEAAAESGAPSRDPKSESRERAGGNAISPEEAARNRAAHDKRVAEQRKSAAERQLSDAERAENVRAFEQKQAEAAERAARNAAEAEQAEKRRAERRKRREAQEAQREELRKRAEEAAK